MSHRGGGLALVAALSLGACGNGSGANSDAGSPRSGAWRTLGQAPTARYQGSAVVRRGVVYYMGGLLLAPNGLQETSSAVDIFDPVAGTWTAGPALPDAAPKHHLAVAVQDDVIYLLGGYVGSSSDPAGPVAVTACFALDDAGWQEIHSAPMARQGATAQSIGGRIYVAGGGTDETTAVASLFVYDPAGDSWTAGTAMPTARSHVASCAVAGRMIVGGGFAGETPATLATVEELDPATGAWTSLPDLPTPRGALGAASLGTACIFVGGFRWGPPLAFATTERFDATTLAWSEVAPMAQARHSMGVTALGGAIYAIDGSPVPFAGYSDLVEEFRP